MFEIVELKQDKKDLIKFIDIAWDIYKDDKNWVAPLRFDLMNTLLGKDNPLFMSGEHAFFMAYDDKRPCGRICVGINESLNNKKGLKDGYICLFECIENREIAFKLFDTACDWLKKRGMDTVKGPVSPTNGDDNRGLLVMGFDGSPVLLNSYNKEYYVDFFDGYGFFKHLDLYAYYGDFSLVLTERYEKIVNYAMKRYDFTVLNLNMKRLDRELLDIKEILDIAMPIEWEDLAPPSIDEIKAEANKLKFMVDPDLICIARSKGRPIGFNIALPDYYEVLKKLNGRLFPFGIFKFLWYRKRIKGARSFIMFVVPEFRKKGVSGAIYYKSFEAAKKKGYTHGEGSTIGETNEAMRRDAEGAGGKHYRTYRIYSKNL